MNSLSKDLNSEVLCKYLGGGRLVAAGTGDATKVTGETIDRAGASNAQMYQTAVVSYGWRAVLADTKTLALALELQESADGSNWDTAEVVYASAVVATSSGGTTEKGVTTSAFDLSKRKRYMRFNHTPDLNASGTDTAEVVGQIVMGGGRAQPAT